MAARSADGRGDKWDRHRLRDARATTGLANASGSPRSVLAQAATFACWLCLGGGGRWRDFACDGGYSAAHQIDRTDDSRGCLLRPDLQRGNSMDSSDIFADHEGQRQASRRVAWHLVCAAFALFVGLTCLSLAWAGATVQYQARVEREQLQLLARPQMPRPTDSSFVSLGGWRGEVLP